MQNIIVIVCGALWYNAFSLLLGYYYAYNYYYLPESNRVLLHVQQGVKQSPWCLLVSVCNPQNFQIAINCH